MRYNTISITFITDFANKKVGEVIECDVAQARDLVIRKVAKYTPVKAEIIEDEQVIEAPKKKAKKAK